MINVAEITSTKGMEQAQFYLPCIPLYFQQTWYNPTCGGRE